MKPISKLATAVAAITVAGVAYSSSATVSAPSAPQVNPNNAECAGYGGGHHLFSIGNGETILFLPRHSQTLGALRGPKTYHHPELDGRMTRIGLQSRCMAILYGKTTGGHQLVRQTGPVRGIMDVQEIAGMKCDCQ